jgi:hypothetical protein
MPAHSNRNFILAYILLVGLPIVGLVAVIKSGRGLTAPISVDGLWRIQVDPESLASLPCGKAIAENPETTLAISQSGKNFTLSLANGPRSTSSGTIDSAAVKASIAPAPDWSAQAGCGASQGLTLVATVDAKADPRTLAGHLSANNCPTCGVVPFHAVRQNPPVKRGLH